MSMKYNTILFDLDGTLTDSGEGITKAVRYALEKRGIEVHDLSELNVFIGPPLTVPAKELYGIDGADADAFVRDYREYYAAGGLFENRVYDKMPEMLSALKGAGIRLVVATSKPEKFTFQILEHFDLIKYFDFVAGATMDGTRIKKTDVIAYALKNLQSTQGLESPEHPKSPGEPVSTENIVMVGDRSYDIEGAKANGLDSIGVLYGYGDREELLKAGATRIAGTVEELGEILLATL